MKKIVVLMAVVIAALSLASCGSKKEVIYVYNWGAYIADGILEEFTKETGITVKYETFPSNEEMYSKLKVGGVVYDVIIPSDYMIEKMIKEDMLLTINHDNVPNFEYVDDLFKGLQYDMNNEYSVAYMWGTVGILYNTTMVDEEVDSWDILWNPKYERQIFMYDSVRDSIGVALRKLGYSLNTKNVDELNAAKEELLRQTPLVQAYLTDFIKDKMVAGEGALSVVYSGDAVAAMELNENLDYAVPNEGSNYWFDGMVIPKVSKNKEGAEKFINFMCRPDISAKNSEFIGYTTPISEALQYMDTEIVESPVFWPPQEILDKCDYYYDLGDTVKVYYDIWTDVLMSK